MIIFILFLFLFLVVIVIGMVIGAFSLLNESINDRKRKKEFLEAKKAEAEKLEARQKIIVEFQTSSEYKFIEQFAKKYKNRTNIFYLENKIQIKDDILGNNDREYSKLKNLLKSKEKDFSSDELKGLVAAAEVKKQRSHDARAKMLINDPQNRKEILESYLNYFQSYDDERLETLAEVLQERDLSVQNLEALKSEVAFVENEMEVKRFEEKLASEENQLSIENVDKFIGFEFEDYLKTLFSKMGYQVEQTKLSGDQGADLVVVKFAERTVIQAKCYGGKVGNKAVQEIMAAISFYRAQKGMVITNNYFTPAAVELANANSIELIDRNGLEELINNHW